MPADMAHLTPLEIEELAEGILPQGEAVSARAHVEACTRCAAEVERLEVLFARLGELRRFAPSATFADGVMARVQIAPQESGAFAWLRRLVPSTRRGWMLVGSAAVAPALPLLALVVLLLTQPLLSPLTLWQWALLRTQSMTQAGLAWIYEHTVTSGAYGFAESGYAIIQSLPMTAVGIAATLVAIAIPLSGWGLLRLTRAPMGSVNHGN